MDIDEKYFRCYAKIDLDSIRKNTLILKGKLKPGTGLIAVIKTDGYGHGAVPVAKEIDDLCYGYAVATAQEGHNLRRHGITKPIFILGYTPAPFYRTIFDDDMIPAVYSRNMAEELSQYGKKINKEIKINIAVDTGMSRIGYIPSDMALKEIADITKLPYIKSESMFTHFAKADYKDKSFTKKQFNEFEKFVKKLENMGVHFPILQCANSAAIMEMEETSLNLSRAGISMYGLYPSDEINKENVKLYPAMSIYSRVICVKKIKAGQGISYGQTYIAERNMTVATVSIGYGDGYPRSLSNKGYVLINGRKAPIVGRICMDQFMVDVTDIDVKMGDKVTIVGRDRDEEILTDDISRLSGRFNYEFVCDLGKRVPRVFVKAGKVVCTKDYFNDDYNI